MQNVVISDRDPAASERPQPISERWGASTVARGGKAPKMVPLSEQVGGLPRTRGGVGFASRGGW